jgi:hypothetical protein
VLQAAELKARTTCTSQKSHIFLGKISLLQDLAIALTMRVTLDLPFMDDPAGPDRNLPNASTLGAGHFKQVTCHHCTHHRNLIAEFWVGEQCSACVEACSTCLEWLLHLKVWAFHGATPHLHFPLQSDWTTLPPLTRLHHYIFCFCQGVYGLF